MKNEQFKREIGEKIAKIAGDNVGAIKALGQVLEITDDVDAMLAVTMLDDLGIHGANIWTLYKDECNEDANLFVRAIVRKRFGDQVTEAHDARLNHLLALNHHSR